MAELGRSPPPHLNLLPVSTTSTWFMVRRGGASSLSHRKTLLGVGTLIGLLASKSAQLNSTLRPNPSGRRMPSRRCGRRLRSTRPTSKPLQTEPHAKLLRHGVLSTKRCSISLSLVDRIGELGKPAVQTGCLRQPRRDRWAQAELEQLLGGAGPIGKTHTTCVCGCACCCAAAAHAVVICCVGELRQHTAVTCGQLLS